MMSHWRWWVMVRWQNMRLIMWQTMWQTMWQSMWQTMWPARQLNHLTREQELPAFFECHRIDTQLRCKHQNKNDDTTLWTHLICYPERHYTQKPGTNENMWVWSDVHIMNDWWEIQVIPPPTSCCWNWAQPTRTNSTPTISPSMSLCTHWGQRGSYLAGKLWVCWEFLSNLLTLCPAGNVITVVVWDYFIAWWSYFFLSFSIFFTFSFSYFLCSSPWSRRRHSIGVQGEH